MDIRFVSCRPRHFLNHRRLLRQLLQNAPRPLNRRCTDREILARPPLDDLTQLEL